MINSIDSEHYGLLPQVVHFLTKLCNVVIMLTLLVGLGDRGTLHPPEIYHLLAIYPSIMMITELFVTF